MKKYFRLYPYCHLEIGKNNSCLYDISSGKMIKINKENAELLKRCQENEPLSSIDIELGILDELMNLNLGTYYDDPQFIEPFFETNETKNRIFIKNNTLRQMFILTSTDCNMNCKHCNVDSSIFRKTGCKIWPQNINFNILTQSQWRIILEAFYNLHGEELLFIGGEPFLEFNFIKTIVGIAKKIGISKFSIFTNGSILDDDILRFLMEYEIKVYIQVFEADENKFKAITNSDISSIQIIDNIRKLSDYHVNLQLSVLVTRDNDEDIVNIVNTFQKEAKVRNIKIEFLYPKPNNNYYSKKYTSFMYDKKREFSHVNAHKMQFLHQYNPSFFGQITLRRDGKVSPHPMLLTSIIGDLQQDDLSTIINSDVFQEYLTLNKGKISKCSTCAYKYNCLDDRVIESFATSNLYGMEYCNI
ncbi:radical SAM protein [Bacillus cereus]|uniref:Radical SAM protein n=2 Tax=Bacillus cereus TaxID=1396 RepID=A0AAW4R1L4_BACCE|nr:radical SAM protein [Bacillus cereus]MBY0040903.1 radical SAM protein [Bacillus cereus]MDA2440184.1 radical SAM protein [Bacillus cereus]MDA2446493.1 radical SAM protein [Bacillus cereus]